MSPNIISRFFTKFLNDWRTCETDCLNLYFGYVAFLGLLPKTSGELTRRSNVRYWIPRISFLGEMIKSFVMSPLSVYMFSDQSILKIIDPLAAMFISVFMAVYCGSFIFQQNRFVEVKVALKEMEECGFLHKESPRWIEEETKWFSRLTFCYYVSTIFVVTPFLLIAYPLYAYKEKTLMFSYWYPFEYYRSPNFELITFTVTGLGAYGLLVMGFVNGLLMALLERAIAHLQLLNHNLSVIFRKNTPDNINSNSETILREFEGEREIIFGGKFYNRKFVFKEPTALPEVCFTSCNTLEERVGLNHIKIFARRKYGFAIENRLKICIRHHQSIERFTEKVGHAFQIILLQQFCCCVVPFVLAIIMLTNANEFDAKIVIVLVLGGFCWADQIAFSWLADKITGESEGVREAVYGCDWLRASEGFKRSMRIIMSRSNQPLVVKVAGLMPLNMESFYKIVEMTYTYYMSLATTLDARKKYEDPS